MAESVEILNEINNEATKNIENEPKVISRQVNFNLGKHLAMIEYPGLVQNVDKMLDTLRGIKHISRVFSGEEKHLSLRYHVKNPFNKAVLAECHSKCGVLLSIKIRRSKRDPTRILQQEVTILGHASKRYTFDNLCDFQYLPLHMENNKNTQTTFRNILPEIMPKHALDLEFFTKSNSPLMIMPFHFARSDMVPITIFRSDAHENGQNESLGLLARTTHDTRDNIAFSLVDAFPTQPDSQVIKRMKLKYVSDEQFEKVKALFQQCPMWTRLALLHESGVSKDKLKCIMHSMAFYFHTGPWRTMFVRYGYDPRKDFKSRYYQTFDFRLHYRSGMFEWVGSRREILRKKKKEADNSGTMQGEASENLKDLFYPYLEENKLPRTRQCLMRYCDIHIPVVQDMLDKIPPPIHGAVCNERTGWLPFGFDDQVRQLVRSNIKNLLRNRFRKEKCSAEIENEHVESELDEDVADDSDSPNTSASELPDEFQEFLDASESE